MAGAFRPLTAVEPQLTPEQEDAVWAAMDAVDAAKKTGDWLAYIDAAGVLLDMAQALRLVNVTGMFREAAIAPQGRRPSKLVQAMQRLIELDPVAADGYLSIAVDRMDGRAGVEDAGWAALVVNAYMAACDELGMPQPRDTPILAARNVVAFTVENLWACVDQGYWAREDVERHLWDAVEMLDRVLPGKGGAE